MGPRPCGRGRYTASTKAVTGRAASMGPRPCGRGRRAWDAALRRGCTGFNGATALRPWTAGPARRLPPQGRASMGPRPCGRGRLESDALRVARVAVLQWGHGLAAVDGTHLAVVPDEPTCFNGATALRPWTVRGQHCVRGREQMLQWGHGLAAVDGSRTAGPLTQSRGFNGATALRPWTEEPKSAIRQELEASMGPRPCGRGRAAAAAATPTSRCFNGATALRPWTVPPGRRAGRPLLASMGPRPCGRGRDKIDRG